MMQSKGKQWQRYVERLGAYKEFLRKNGYDHLLTDSDRLIYATIRTIRGVSIGIAGLNSAWSCCRDGEKGKLWMAGAWQIGHLRTAIKNTLFNIALKHHPSNWLVEWEDPRIHRLLEQNFRFELHGHEHQGWVNPSADGYTRIAAAACYERSDHENGYNFVRLNLDAGTGEVWLREIRIRRRWLGSPRYQKQDKQRR